MLQQLKNYGVVMLLDHTRRLLEKLLSDAVFRDGIADFIRSQGFLCTPEELKYLALEVLMHSCEKDTASCKLTGKQEDPYANCPQGYEYWVG